MDRNVFQKIMMSTGKQRMADQIKFLKAVPLLKSLPDEILNRYELSLDKSYNCYENNCRCKIIRKFALTVLFIFRLSDAFELVNFSHGDYIVRQGTSGDTFYIISEGQVRVTRRVEGKDG